MPEYPQTQQASQDPEVPKRAALAGSWAAHEGNKADHCILCWAWVHNHTSSMRASAGSQAG